MISMPYIRDLVKVLSHVRSSFRGVLLTGPRQTGKTTLVRSFFSELPYVLLETPETRLYAESDPRGFLKQFSQGAILDEIQNIPSLLSYLQGEMDDPKGRFWVLTGSNQFYLRSQSAQSLAGRIAVLQLLPLTLTEAPPVNLELDELLWMGAYPEVRSKQGVIDPALWYSSYVQTYLERDVRGLSQIKDLMVFQRFLKLCAARTGQVLNLSALATEVGMSVPTVESWLSILESSYILFRLPPFFKNYSKRLTKSPKLHFLDSGLACYLLGISSPSLLHLHSLRPFLFESFVVSEFLKMRFNQGIQPELYYWREAKGLEIDLLIYQGSHLIGVEVKSGETVASDAFRSLQKWASESSDEPKKKYLVYGGGERQERSDLTVLPWRQMSSVFA